MSMSIRSNQQSEAEEIDIEGYNNELFLDLGDQDGDIQKAETHLIANLIFDYNKLDQNNIDLCDDCYNPIPPKENIPQFPFCVDIQKFSRFGIGVYLYFYYIKFVAIMLLVILFMAVIPQAYYAQRYYNEVHEFCSTKVESKFLSNCTSFESKNITFMGKLSYYNYEEKKDLIGLFSSDSSFDSTLDFNLINLITQVVLFISSSIFITICYNLNLEEDLLNITPEDFTLMISNLPTDVEKLNEIKDKLTQVQVYEINRTYKLSYFYEQKREYLSKRRKLQKLIRSNQLNEKAGLFKKPVTQAQIKQDIKKCDQNMTNILKEIDKNPNSILHVNDLAFFIFKDTSDYEVFRNNFPKSTIGIFFQWFYFILSKSLFRCCLSEAKRENIKKKTLIRCEIAPEPSDILWENLEFTNFSRLIRKIIVWIITLLILVASFFILYYINQSQSKVDTTNKYAKYLISIVFSLAIIIINAIINKVLLIITDYEKNTSKTTYLLSYSIKLMIAWFINTAIIPIITVYLGKGIDNDRELLIQNSFVFFLSNAFVTPLLYLFDFAYLFRIFKRKLLRRNYLITGHSIEHSQKELNEVFENPEMELSLKYAFIGKTLFMTVFYIPILPVGVPISIAGIFLLYMIEKYNTVNRYKKPPGITAAITLLYLTIFRIVIFAYAVSEYIFTSYIFFEYSLASIIVFGTLIIIPFERFLQKDFLEVTTKDVYDQEYFKFNTNYDTQNPLTKRTALRNMLIKIKSEGLMSDEEYSDFSKRMANGEIIDLLEYYKDKKGILSQSSKQITHIKVAKLSKSKTRLVNQEDILLIQDNK